MICPHGLESAVVLVKLWSTQNRRKHSDEAEKVGSSDDSECDAHAHLEAVYRPAIVVWEDELLTGKKRGNAGLNPRCLVPLPRFVNALVDSALIIAR